ncbi:MAG: hypothetical protein IJH34_16090, partial [Romboutsia sp.]|nr:hypothetical protein [Romboutsia sp.]
KYKRCCLETDSTFKITANKSEQLKKAYSNMYKSVYIYASKRKDFNELCTDASNMFFPKKLLNYNEDINIVFNSYFLKDYVIKGTETTIALDFYKEYADKLSNLQANILYSMISSHIGLYKIESINNTQLIITDVLTNNKFEILDNLLSKHLNVGECIIANIMNIAGLNIISEILYKINSQSIFDTLFDDLSSLYNKEIASYDCVEDFLRNNTLLFYCHIMQIVSPEACKYFEKLVNNIDNLEIVNADSSEVLNNEVNDLEVLNDEANDLDCDNKSNSISLSPETFNKIDSEYVMEVLDILSSSVEDNNLNKVSESGWVSAAEYHVKKMHGLNITQSQIAEKYNISTSTLGKRYKVVKEFSL